MGVGSGQLILWAPLNVFLNFTPTNTSQSSSPISSTSSTSPGTNALINSAAIPQTRRRTMSMYEEHGCLISEG
ncbi:hypothetical protein HK096_001371, partial [Nowakowskiella sp. JEL0078]